MGNPIIRSDGTAEPLGRRWHTEDGVMLSKCTQNNTQQGSIPSDGLVCAPLHTTL
jgi:hypothetical protein